jgi:hypothetical protein
LIFHRSGAETLQKNHDNADFAASPCPDERGITWKMNTNKRKKSAPRRTSDKTLAVVPFLI